jgi:hypothetical protein
VKASRSRTSSREDVLSDGGYDSSDEYSHNRNRHNGSDESEMMFKMEMDLEDDDDEYEPRFTPQSPTAAAVEYTLIPIDHGYTLPTTISGFTDLWFEWLKWPQAKVPFDAEELSYIERLNADEDITILKLKFGDLLGNECFRVLRITTMWLKVAARAGLTPYTIGYALCRKHGETHSALEKMTIEAQQEVEVEVEVDASGTKKGVQTAGEGSLLATLSAEEELLFFSKLQAVMERSAMDMLDLDIARPRALLPSRK